MNSSLLGVLVRGLCTAALPCAFFGCALDDEHVDSSDVESGGSAPGPMSDMSDNTGVGDTPADPMDDALPPGDTPNMGMQNDDMMPQDDPDLPTDMPADEMPMDMNMPRDPIPVMGEEGKLEGITDAHNMFRAATSPDDPLPPVEWDPEIAAVAQQWAEHLSEDCAFEHSGNNYGENLARFGASSESGPDATGVNAVENWFSEIECYEFGQFMTTDQCSSECDDSGGCGHYTQVVWRATQRIGCGVASCFDGRFYQDTYVCNYDPPGNFIGREPY